MKGVVSLLLVCAASLTGIYLRDDLCQCAPPKERTAPTSISYSIVYNNGNVTVANFNTAFAFADDKWTAAFARRNHTVSIAQGTGDLKIRIVTTLDETGVYYPPGHPTYPHEMHLAANLITNDASQAFINGLVLHEMGHVLGFGQSPCTNRESVMSGTDQASYPTDLTSCDREALTEHYGPIKRDEDGDGWSPDDAAPAMDCADDNIDMYPGAWDTNPQCDQLASMWDDNGDWNCDVTPDINQISSVCSQLPSPILLDLSGNGFRLTDRDHGVLFDLDGQGERERLPWTDPSGDDAWLALDRNSNGVVDDGGELFGTYTAQPRSDEPNGFLALGVFDTAAQGGNDDKSIDRSDTIFGRLTVWRDANHDGISQPEELRGLSAIGVRRLSLEYREFLRVDQFGNWFRYGARLFDGRSRDVGPMAFDVFLGYPPDRVPPGPTRRRMDEERRRIRR